MLKKSNLLFDKKNYFIQSTQRSEKVIFFDSKFTVIWKLPEISWVNMTITFQKVKSKFLPKRNLSSRPQGKQLEINRMKNFCGIEWGHHPHWPPAVHCPMFQKELLQCISCINNVALHCEKIQQQLARSRQNPRTWMNRHAKYCATN